MLAKEIHAQRLQSIDGYPEAHIDPGIDCAQDACEDLRAHMLLHADVVLWRPQPESICVPTDVNEAGLLQEVFVILWERHRRASTPIRPLPRSAI